MLRIAAGILILATMTSVVCAQSNASGRTWLNGTWDGTGYQIDSAETWTMRLVVAGNRYKIEYPSLKCSGKWNPVRVGSWIARFRERITLGIEECTDKGMVVIERLGHRQLAFRYSNPGAPNVTASAILNRKK